MLKPSGWIVYLVPAIVCAACGGDAETRISSASEPLAEGGSATVGVAAGPTSLLPPFASVALDFELGSALYPGLNYGEWEDGRLVYPQPHPLALARSWEQTGARLTYRLDSSRHWSDGHPIRAADVVFTYGLLQDTALALPLAAATAHLDSVVAADDSTVTFFFQAEYPGMQFDTGVGILPLHVYGPMASADLPGFGADLSEDAELVVSGPFRLETWRASDRIVLARNQESPTPARLDRVVFVVQPNETSRLAALRAGETDVAQLSSFHEATALAGAEGFRVQGMPQRGYDYIAWNPEAHPALADPGVRRALSLIIDREEVIEALVMRGYAVPAHGPYGPLFASLASHASGPLHDPPEAVRLLEAAGWTDSDGDGVRDKAGRDLRFELLTTSGNERREAAVLVLQSQLASAGVAVEIRQQEIGSLFGRAQARDFEALLMGWQVALDPDISFFWADPGSPVNFVGYDNPRVTALMDSALSARTTDTAAPFWKQAAQLIADDYPYAFLWYFDQLVAVGPGIGGVETDVIGFTRTMHKWGRRLTHAKQNQENRENQEN